MMVLPRTAAAAAAQGAGLLFIISNLSEILAATTCSTVTVSGVGDASGTYEESVNVIQPVYTRLAGSEVYRLEFDDNNMLWSLAPTANEYYPEYETFDDATHPVDITQDWNRYDSYMGDGTEVDVSIECAESTSTSSDTHTGSTCSTVEVESAGTASGIYKYDGGVFQRYAGSDIYEISVNAADDAWTIEPIFDGYPKYETFDAAAHPADITLPWIGYDDFADDGTETSGLSITCTDEEDLTIQSTCTEVIVKNTIDELSGTYSYAWDPCTDSFGPGQGSQVFEMATDDQVYGIYVSTYDHDAWTIRPIGSTSYPKYRTFDAAQHPADITQNWIGFDDMGDDGTEVSNLSIECAGNSTTFSSLNTTCTSNGPSSNGTSSSYVGLGISIAMVVAVICCCAVICNGNKDYTRDSGKDGLPNRRAEGTLNRSQSLLFQQ